MADGKWQIGIADGKSGQGAIAFVGGGGYKGVMQSISSYKKLAVGLLVVAFAFIASAREFLVYFGTYTGAKSKGIYVSRLDVETGEVTPPQLAAETVSPSFLAIHPSANYLYAANEVSQFNGKPGGSISAFAIDKATGKLTLVNQESSVGAGPCHLVVDATGKDVLVANYGSGVIATLPVGQDGKLAPASSSIRHSGSSVDPQRQKEPHAHSINLSPDNHFAFAADLGLDKIMIYQFEAERGKLRPNDPAFAAVAPGSGPRHFAFHPSGKFAYVINEMTCTITGFQYDSKTGALKELQTISTLPSAEPMQPAYSTAEIQVHPSGRFLYGSNRGHDAIAVFAIDPQTGKLTAIEHVSTQGKTPRNFGIDPTGRFLLAANQNSNSVVVFRIDPQTGRLTATGRTLEVGAPVCVKFVASK
jgi:6-phosphogluconolactonase